MSHIFDAVWRLWQNQKTGEWEVRGSYDRMRINWIKPNEIMIATHPGTLVYRGWQHGNLFVFERHDPKTMIWAPAISFNTWGRMAKANGYHEPTPPIWQPPEKTPDEELRELFDDTLTDMIRFVISTKDNWMHTAALHGERYRVFADGAQLELERLQALQKKIRGYE